MLNRLRIWLVVLVSTALIVAALAVGLFRFAVGVLPGYKADIEAQVGKIIGRPVAVGHIDLRWRGWGPEVTVDELSLLNDDSTAPALRLRRASARFPLTALLPKDDRLFRPQSIVIEGIKLTVERQVDGTLSIRDFAGGSGGVDQQQLLKWLFQPGDVEARDVTIAWVDEQRPALEPQVVHIPTARLNGDGQLQSLRANINLPEGLGEAAQLQVTAIGSPDRWNANFDIVASQLQLVAFPQQLLRSGGLVSDGRIDVTASGTVGSESPLVVSGEWLLQDLEWRSGQYAPRQLWPELKGRAQYAGSATGWKLGLTSLEHDGIGIGSATVEFNRASTPQLLYITADELPLSELAALLVVMPGANAQMVNWLEQAKPQGVGTDLVARLESENGRLVGGDARMQISSLAWSEAKPVPGMQGITGLVAWDGRQVTLSLAEAPATLDVPWLFRQPIVASAFATTLAVRARENGGLGVSVNDLKIRNADIAVDGQASVQVIRGQAPHLWLDLGVGYLDATSVSRYLPVGVLQKTPSLLRWLDSALLAGQLSGGRLSFDGPLQPNTLQMGTANFGFDARFTGGELKFHQQWPVVKDIDAQLRFRNIGLNVAVFDASFLSIKTDRFDAAIPDFFNAELSLSGTFSSSVVEALSLLRDTPLKKRFGKVLLGFETSGKVNGELQNFSLSLKPKSRPTLNAKLNISDGRLKHAGWSDAATKIRAQLQVSEKSFSVRNLSGAFKGTEARGSLVSSKAGLRLALSGAVQNGWLEENLKVPKGMLTGSAGWDGSMLIGGGGVKRWNVETDLQGLAISLPLPFGKAAEWKQSLKIKGGPIGQSLLRIDIDYDRWVSSALRWRQQDSAYVFDQGQLSVGGAPAVLGQVDVSLPATFSVDGNLGEIDASEWIAAISRFRTESQKNTQNTSGSAAVSLGDISLKFQTLKLGSQRLSNQQVHYFPYSGGGRFRLNGDAIAGMVDWQSSANNVLVDLERLHIPKQAKGVDARNKDGGADGRTAPPASMPNIDFRCLDCRFGELQLGNVSFLLKSQKDAIRLQSLKIQSPNLTASGDGLWESSRFGVKTQLNIEAKSKRIRQLLAELGYAGTLEAATSSLKTSLNWVGSPANADLTTLGGSIDLKVKDGRLLKVDPGAARVFGLLSFNTLPRRLAADFRDVTEPGMAFDRIEGDFKLADGDAFTDGLTIDGPSAKVVISGRTGIVAKDYDQLVRVKPKLGSSLVIAGTVLGGPGVGAVLLVGQELLSRPFDGIGGLTYKVTGSWENPDVESPKMEPGDIKTGPRGKH